MEAPGAGAAPEPPAPAPHGVRAQKAVAWGVCAMYVVLVCAATALVLYMIYLLSFLSYDLAETGAGGSTHNRE